MFLKNFRNIFCFSGTKNVSTINVSSARTGKHSGQQCFLSNLSSILVPRAYNPFGQREGDEDVFPRLWNFIKRGYHKTCSVNPNKGSK